MPSFLKLYNNIHLLSSSYGTTSMISFKIEDTIFWASRSFSTFWLSFFARYRPSLSYIYFSLSPCSTTNRSTRRTQPSPWRRNLPGRRGDYIYIHVYTNTHTTPCRTRFYYYILWFFLSCFFFLFRLKSYLGIITTTSEHRMTCLT